MLLHEKIAIVTGAGSGIGRATALRFAREGAHVVVAERDEDSGRQTVDDVTACGRTGLFVQTDVACLKDIEHLVSTTVKTFGRIDVLMNNAGVSRKLDMFEVTEEDWDWIYSIDAKGLFFCMQAVAREMVKAERGRIINIASTAGKGYFLASNIAYGGAKGAVIAMTRLAAARLAPHNINVNAICPGSTRTSHYARVMREIAERDQITEAEAMGQMDSLIPLRRSNEPEDIANLAAFLASDEARNVTGQSWNVDGGLMWD
jgi:NAD(P)-dependent dehydrogenase (short-subunit alcohol dehydrogenase family)